MNASTASRIAIVSICQLVVISGDLAAQTPASLPPPIRDNSFLIEEAYNQEWGVVQHVGTFRKARGSSAWQATFTQEWPAPGERHQLSYTIPVEHFSSGNGMSTDLGDLALNYRYQIPLRAGSPLALAPRASLLLPMGGRGTSLGLELNLPASIELNRLLVTHFNVGARWGDGATFTGPSEAFVGESLILLAHPKVNFMIEALWSAEGSPIEILDEGGYESALHIAPGVRGAIDFASGLQVVPGIAFPIGVGPSEGEKGMYLYVSFEHPFRRR